MKILEFLQEKNGKFSSSRLFMLLVCISSIMDWQHAIWTVGIWTPEYQTVGLILGILGFKFIHKTKEQWARNMKELGKNYYAGKKG